MLLLLWVSAAGTEAAGQSFENKLMSARLYQKVVDDGVVRVIAGVASTFIPEGRLSQSGAAHQRHGIARAQIAVVDRLNRKLKRPTSVRLQQAIHFRSIPYIAFTVDGPELLALVNDPAIISIQEDHHNSQALTQSIPLTGVDTVWRQGYSGQGQIVAVLDTGVDQYHPFLAGKVVSEACYSTNMPSLDIFSFCPGMVSSSTRSGSAAPCPLEGCDHGTHVAGIAAGYNGWLAGMAKDARIIAIQVFSRLEHQPGCGNKPAPCTTALDADIIRALERVYELRRQYNIAAVNLSLGGGRYSSACDNQYPAYSAILSNLRSVGTAVIAASGNESLSNSINSPACISSVISVGASAQNNQIAAYSNSAAILDLLAPGSSIYSSAARGFYGFASGTSMATPHVAGAWAVLKSARPDASVDMLLEALKNSGVPLTHFGGMLIKPRIQVDAALDLVTHNRPLLPVPRNRQQTIYYRAAAYPLAGADLPNLKPIGAGPVAGGGDMFTIHVSMNAFSAPVDLYFLAYLPEYDSEVYSWTGTTFVPVDAMFGQPWKSSVAEPVNTQVFDTFPADTPGLGADWHFGLVAIPAGATDLSAYYLWYTSPVH